MHPLITDVVSKLANFAGYQILPKWRARTHEHAELLKRLLSSRNIDLIVDVGANTGQFAQWMRTCGYKGNIASLEPITSIYTQLEEAAWNDSKWTTHRIALGAIPECMAINVTRGLDLCSFLIPVSEPPDIPAIKKGNFKIERDEEVDVHRLDDFLKSIDAGTRKILLKLDTQGYDLEVLKGAGGALRQIEVIQSEVSVLPLYQRMPDWLESIAEMRRLGFTSAGMFPVVRDSADRVVEYDAVMVRLLQTL